MIQMFRIVSVQRQDSKLRVPFRLAGSEVLVDFISFLSIRISSKRVKDHDHDVVD